jgi:DNA-binding transcriptional MerR regulator
MNTAAVARLCGVSLRQLQFWDEQGLVVPARVEGPGGGYGHVRKYSAADIRRVRLIVALLSKGFTLSQIRKILRNDLKQNVDFACGFFVTDGKRVCMTASASEAIAFASARDTGKVALIELSEDLGS